MADKLILGGDPISSVSIGDIAYSKVDLDDIHDPVIVDASLASTTPVLSLPDRTLTPEGARASSDPVVAVAYDTAVVGEESEASDRQGRELRLGLGGATGRGLAGMVRAARAARLVRVSRTDFQSDVHFSQVVLALCGAGVVVEVAGSAELRGFLHPDLISALTSQHEDALADELAWGSMSARLRRLAWLRHDCLLTTTGQEWSLTPRRLPSVSVLLATNRPSYIPAALEQIARQSHPDFEVIVAVHGVAGAALSAEEHMDRNGLEGSVLEMDEAMPLGQVLNSAADRSSGHVITKWDDDDLYGPDHLVDMCIGLRYSRAALVGKAPEFIYFTSNRSTVLRNHSGFESFSDVIAGGTMTMPRVAFDDIGGFPPIPRAVDHYLKRQLSDAGSPIYRMHGFGFALVRHGDGHTWALSDDELAAGAHRRWSGIPAVAGVGSHS